MRVELEVAVVSPAAGHHGGDDVARVRREVRLVGVFQTFGENESEDEVDQLEQKHSAENTADQG